MNWYNACMQVRYNCMGKRLSISPKQLAVVLGVVALPVTLHFETVSASTATPAANSVSAAAVVTSHPKVDPRTVRLRKFLSSLHCPVSSLSEDFIHAADDNHLDWRLLPSISVIESSGGKAYKNNNMFGWANGDHLFPTVRSAIHEIAFHLGKGPIYRNRDVEAKLHLYNPDQAYAGKVMDVMNRISPVVDLRPASRVVRRSGEFSYATD